MKFDKKLITIFFTISLFYAISASAAQYTYSDLGLGDFSTPLGINNSGQIVGSYWSTNNKAGDGLHAFTYSSGIMQDLGTLEGRYSEARGVNSNGQVVGYDSSNAEKAFIYNGTMKELGSLGSGISKANAINNSGQVVGRSYTSNFFQHAFLYSNGSMKDLGTLAGTYTLGSSFDSEATDINENGQVVGVSITKSYGVHHAFLYDNGGMKDLGTLGGNNSQANSINDIGQVVGVSDTNVYGANHAFLYDNGTMKDLGTLGGSFSKATAINNSGQIVGYAYTGNGNADQHAFLYENGKMVDLNSFLDNSTVNAGWYLSSAYAINDNGWIVGIASNTLTNTFRGYMLSISAVPEMDTLSMLLAGLGVMGFVVRCKQKRFV